MARKKKPVDDTPICDPAYLRRIDPLWMPGPVPPRFWEDRVHRRDYLLWSAQRLGLRTMEDLYGMELTASYKQNGGGGLCNYWGQASLAAVQDCFPEYDWKAWLFRAVPIGFWDSPANRQSYMRWLGQRLGYRCTDDWYQVIQDDFLQNRGDGLMTQYHRSPVRAVLDLVPGRNWCEWKFEQVPAGFWDVAANRHRYLRWVGKELGFRQPADWLRIQARQIVRRHGTALLSRYHSLWDLMREFLPHLDWDQVDIHGPIRDKEVLAWADAYHARHGTWPTSDSGVIPESGGTWQGIEACLRAGYRGLAGGGSLAAFLAKHRGVGVGRTPPTLSEEQILAWADVYFAAQGKWPTSKSGPIPGTRETWNAVGCALYSGGRGLRSGCTLAQFLAQRRGARNHMDLPPLTDDLILAWARAHFEATGRWPIRVSGPIADASGETWIAVDQALQKGVRGLPGGSSLAQLLARRQGVRNRKALPPLMEEQILAWAQAHFEATGRWPTAHSGPIVHSPQETWFAVDQALRNGGRGMRGKSSLAKLLKKHGLKEKWMTRARGASREAPFPLADNVTRPE